MLRRLDAVLYRVAGVPDRSWLNHPIAMEEVRSMMLGLRACVHQLFRHVASTLNRGIIGLTRPATRPLHVDTLADLARTKPALIAENALLRQQLLVLRRQVSRPQLSPLDRFRLVVLAAMASTWKQTLQIVQPETLLRWHREGFRLFWTTRSGRAPRRPRIPEETITLIRQMAAENPLWGAERIRGELLKLDIRVSKRTVQKYRRSTRPRQRTLPSFSSSLVHGQLFTSG